jgi:hypothetical protein
VPYFADAQEVYGTLGRMLEIAGADGDLGMQTADTVVRSEYSEPDSVITISLRPGESRVDFGDTDLEAEIVMSMRADVAHRFWLGEVNVPLALARGDMQATGPTAKILRFVPLLKPVFTRYRELLVEQGREDLAGA